MYRNKQSNCEWFRNYRGDEGAASDDHQECNARLFGFWFFGMMLPHMIGQPRTPHIFVLCSLTMLTVVAIVRFHETSIAAQTFLYLMLAAFLTFVVVLKRITENTNRARFEIGVSLETHIHEVAQRSAALKTFMLTITPECLHTRLLSETGGATLEVDLSPKAFCLVVELRDTAKFVQSMLPQEAATQLTRIHHQIINPSRSYGYHHIRTYGDANYFVSNLFSDDFATVDDAALKGIQFATESCFVQMQSHPVGISAGFACDALVGMPLGRSFIRYDLFGPALTTAEMLCSTCPSGRISVAKNLQQLTNNVFEDYGRSGGDYSSSSVVFAGDSIASFSVNDDAVVQSASSTVPIPASISTSSDTNHQTSDQLAPFVIKKESEQEPAEAAQQSEQQVEESSPPQQQQNRQSNIPLDRISNKLLPPNGNSGVAELSSVSNDAAGGGDPNDDDGTQRQRCLCCQGAFSTPEVEERAVYNFREHHRTPFILINAFFAGFLTLILCTGTIERSASSDWTMATFIGVLVLCIVSHALVALSVTLTQDRPPPKTWQLHLASTTVVVALIAVNLGRSSPVSDNTGYLVWMYGFSWMYSGSSLRGCILVQTLLVISYAITMLAFRPLVERMDFMPVPFLLLMLHMTVLHHQLERSVFAAGLKNEQVFREVLAHKQVRQSLYETLLPRQVWGKIPSPAALQSNSVQCWGINDCLVMTINVPLDHLTSPHQAAHPQQFHNLVDATIGQIEAAVANTTKGSLSIVRVFGGSMVLAGPVSPSSDLDIVDAASDMGEVVHSLLEQNIRFTAGIAAELVMNVLRLSEFPSYDLMGPAVSMSRAIALAAPVEMVAITERIAELYMREERINERPLVFSAAESWRLRGIGSIKVARINIDDVSQLHTETQA